MGTLIDVGGGKIINVDLITYIEVAKISAVVHLVGDRRVILTREQFEKVADALRARQEAKGEGQ